MINKLVNWIKKQVKDASARGIVIGLSGGIDSSVSAALCKKAVGKNRLLSLIMPCHSSLQDLYDARSVAKILGLNTKTIDLSRIYDSLVKILPKANKIAYANIKPRLRMITMYYYANKLNYLVCGTGNKSEIQCGYFTKHGDGATDILPLGCLLKREVKKLAKDLGIPKRIIDKLPSAGLWQGQTDEGEMGMTYAELDDILERLDKRKKQILPKSKVDRVKRMIKKSEHKRQGPSICHI